MPFVTTQPAFSGPFSLLLELLDGEKLAISELSLARVADDFLSYVEGGEVPPEEVADFLVVAARLLYLKSRLLLPDPPAEILDEQLLEERLRAYQEFAEAAKLLAARFDVAPMLPNPRQSVRRPAEGMPENATPDGLVSLMQRLFDRLQPFLPNEEARLARQKSLEEVVAEWRMLVKKGKQVHMQETLKAASKEDVVLSVLALLQLLQGREIVVQQETPFGPLWISSPAK